MRTRTIYRAMTGAYRTILFTQTVDDFLHRKARQWAKFERELLRRCDERDDLREQNAFLLSTAEAAQAQLAECRAELATARAFISSTVDEPKDYPAEVSA